MMLDWTSCGINYTGHIDPNTLSDGYWLDSNGYEVGIFFLGSGYQAPAGSTKADTWRN